MKWTASNKLHYFCLMGDLCWSLRQSVLQMFARKFRSGKETFVELLFLPNFLYFRKSVLKKLRVKCGPYVTFVIVLSLISHGVAKREYTSGHLILTFMHLVPVFAAPPPF